MSAATILPEPPDATLAISSKPQSIPVCSICRTESARYRCPAHLSIRTCSLACTKQHKTRTSCTGQRDPSAYLKRRDLSTSTGLDRDFNFLTGIEKALASGPMGEGQDGSKRRRRGFDRGLERYCDEHRITILRAPEGMSRARANETRFLPKSRKVAWTVEWVDHEGGVKRSEVLDDVLVEDAWSSASGKKRKRCQVGAGREAEDGQVKRRAEIAEGQEQSALETPTAIAHDHISQGGKPHDHEDRLTQQSTEAQHEDSTTVAATPAHVPSLPQSPSQYFYLRNPRHEGIPKSKRKTIPLIHISGEAILTKCLTRRYVEEFPTIHVLPTPADRLETELGDKYTLDTSSSGGAGIQVLHADTVSDNRITERGAAPHGPGADAVASGPETTVTIESNPGLDSGPLGSGQHAHSLAQAEAQHSPSHIRGEYSSRSRGSGGGRGRGWAPPSRASFATGANKASFAPWASGSPTGGGGRGSSTAHDARYRGGPGNGHAGVDQRREEERIDRAALLDLLRRDVSR